MQNARFKTAHTARTAKHGIHPSRATLFQMFMAAVGFIGVVVFGFLMETASVPITEPSTAALDYGISSSTNSIAILGFILSAFMCAYGVYGLYKIYRQLNDPKNYRNRSRRASGRTPVS